MIISITELKCKNYLKLPRLIVHSMKTASQAKNTPGNISAAIKAAGLKAYTITAWENIEAMKTFRNFGAHRQAMKTMSQTASAFRSKTWESDKIPDWKEAKNLLDTVEMKYT